MLTKIPLVQQNFEIHFDDNFFYSYNFMISKTSKMFKAITILEKKLLDSAKKIISLFGYNNIIFRTKFID